MAQEAGTLRDPLHASGTLAPRPITLTFTPSVCSPTLPPPSWCVSERVCWQVRIDHADQAYHACRWEKPPSEAHCDKRES